MSETNMNIQSLELQLENCVLKKVLLQQQVEISRTKFAELEGQEKVLQRALSTAKDEATRNMPKSPAPEPGFESFVANDPASAQVEVANKPRNLNLVD